MLSLHHQPVLRIRVSVEVKYRNTDWTNFGGYGWIRTTSLALMRRLLFPVELHSRCLSIPPTTVGG